MVPVERLSLEKNIGYDGKDHQTDALLNDFQLHQRERSAVVLKTNTIGWHLAAILEKGYSPRESDYSKQRPMA